VTPDGSAVPVADLRVGVLGGGQLGRMLAEAGRPLGVAFRFWDPGAAEPIAGFGEHLRAEWDDDAALERFVDGLDVVTYEFENVPVELARRIREFVPVHPDPAALDMAQDRLSEKSRFESLGIATNAFWPVDGPASLASAIEAVGYPAVIKTRRFGYDGKGQEVLHDAADAEGVFERIGAVPCILEAFVPFERELSLVAVRTADGRFHPYPLVENRHVAGILVRTDAPAEGVSDAVRREAETAVRKLAEALDYVGTLAVEFFEVAGGQVAGGQVAGARTDGGEAGPRLLANEMAPRVHNSGHWTQDGAVTSQFENHVRAVCGLPPGPTTVAWPTVMLNLIGHRGDAQALLACDGARLHDYGKSERPGRKVGHVNVLGSSGEAARERAAAVMAAYGGPELQSGS
jgi:5-(carboxyamino)imidazole ribonucleotide synthase